MNILTGFSVTLMSLSIFLKKGEEMVSTSLKACRHKGTGEAVFPELFTAGNLSNLCKSVKVVPCQTANHTPRPALTVT
jgi:hypothetical protein